jgi:AraC-like DNA-binding protein
MSDAGFNEYFRYGENNLNMFLDYPFRMKGGFVFFCNRGEAIVGTGVQEHTIGKNSEMIVLPGTTFYVKSMSDGFNIRFFSFSKELYDEVSLRLEPSFSMFLREVPFSTHKEGHRFTRYSGTWFDMAELIFKDTENQFRSLIERNFLHSYLMYLYERIRIHLDSVSFKLSRKQELFHRFLSLVHQHCREQKDVSFYADSLHITPRYLWSVTRESSSFKSPKDLIDRYFILEIKILLQSTNLTVSEISYRLDFPNESYFCRYFKRHTGISPSQYRSKHLSAP